MILQRPAEASSLWPKGASRPYLEILVKEFRPGPQDITAERWRSGQNEVILELPAYSAFDNEATTAALLGWVDDNFDLYAKDMKAQPGDFLIGATFDEALRYASANPVRVISPPTSPSNTDTPPRIASSSSPSRSGSASAWHKNSSASAKTTTSTSASSTT